MAVLSFQDLVIETPHPEAGARVCAPHVQATAAPRGDGSWELVRAVEPQAHVIFQDTGVGELESFRLHGDASEDRIAELRAAGIELTEADAGDWYSLQLRGVGEVRLFPQPGRVDRYGFDLVYQVPDPTVCARWWARLLGAKAEAAAEHDYAWVHPLTGSAFAGIVLVRGSQPPRGQRRVRMRFATPNVDDLAVAGASVLERLDDERYRLASPQGLEFDVVVDPSLAKPQVRTRW